jgi:hypothetical protein
MHGTAPEIVYQHNQSRLSTTLNSGCAGDIGGATVFATALRELPLFSLATSLAISRQINSST